MAAAVASRWLTASTPTSGRWCEGLLQVHAGVDQEASVTSFRSGFVVTDAYGHAYCSDPPSMTILTDTTLPGC
jgi:hypothetical protein